MSLFTDQVRGIKSGRTYLFEEDARVGASQLGLVYESHEFIVLSPMPPTSIKTIVDHTTDCSCGRATGAFGLILRADRTIVRNMADPVTSPTAILIVRFNVIDADPISVDPGEYFDWRTTEVEDVFLANDSGIAIPTRMLMD